MSDVTRLVQIHPSALHRELQGETVLLQLDSGEYYGLDEVATRMWQLIGELGDTEKVEAALLEEFDVEPDTLRRDLEQLVSDLVARKLLVPMAE